ncbi:hypothetical protein ACLB2K_002570 [Fragaria x ananassa]
MGNTSSMLTQYDIEEVQQHCNNTFSQQEIVSLYQRFCQLDRSGGGFISADEFLSVPEFAVNPLSQRLLKVLDGLNFKEFVAFLSAFSSRASLQQKIEFWFFPLCVVIFKVYDADNNGKVTFNDMLDVLRDLTGQFISEQQREQVLTHVLGESGYTKDSSLTISDFVKILGNSALKMEVEHHLSFLILRINLFGVSVSGLHRPHLRKSQKSSPIGRNSELSLLFLIFVFIIIVHPKNCFCSRNQSLGLSAIPIRIWCHIELKLRWRIHLGRLRLI